MKACFKIQSRNFLLKQCGMTMLEVLLVMAIGAAFLLLGVKFYQQLGSERDLKRMQENIDQLFLGLKGYYQAHCYANRDFYGSYPAMVRVSPGALDPLVNGAPPVFPVTVATLSSAGFLMQPLSSLAIASNYILQFNLTRGNRSTSYCYNGTCVTQPIKASNTVYLLKAQVAVQISDSTKVSYYKARLNADCISQVSGSTVTPCASSAGTGDYIVFERIPSTIAPSMDSALESSMPNVIQFKRQYTNDENYAVNVDDPIYNSSTPTDTGYENYLCGG